jgi:hypothetical protein
MIDILVLCSSSSAIAGHKRGAEDDDRVPANRTVMILRRFCALDGKRTVKYLLLREGKHLTFCTDSPGVDLWSPTHLQTASSGFDPEFGITALVVRTEIRSVKEIAARYEVLNHERSE